ncbi:MAG: DUF4129 domain-containing protein [Chloroflexota bacterium]|nr:DUF4129 domain-containing protein [Chloroflexota bacterium]MDE3193403.1 DUF4129 domain-containing protein [Chloroflexota bacterium]
MVQARAAPLAARAPLVDRARALLRRTTALDVGAGGVAPVDDSAVAASLATDDASLDAAAREIDLLAASLAPSPVDAAAADARLRQLAADERTGNAQLPLGELVLAWLTRFVAGLQGTAPDPRVALVAAGGTGLAALVLVVAILGRDARERFRREVVLPELRAARAADPAEQLHAADAALRGGRPRDAIHRLYLYALASLAAREIVRYDPSLTDGEVLARATSIPHADALRDLLALHGRIWYGLHDARADDADRARALALRAVA